jgi:NADPH:quinone reductase-like Zn-dependent oxidoreductase
MSEVAERIRNLPPDKVDQLLKQLRPGMKLKQAATAANQPARASNRLFRPEKDENFYLDIDRPGTLDSLTFKARPRLPLNPDHIEVDVESGCLNFRDIAVALGMYPTPPCGMMPEFGCDGAGRVTAIGSAVTRFKVGDEIFCLCSDSTFTRYTRAREITTFLKPPSWSFEQAGSLALVLITVGYSLLIPGRLAPGERILIHSAAGGIGLTAIQIARALGAEIYATAGTEEKRDYLRSLGIKHVMDSRSLDWADDILKLTNGEGVDVVLNALAGEAIDRGISILRPDGRFLELGKRDLVPGRLLDLAPFTRTLVFAAIDTSYLFSFFPERLEPVMDRLRTWLADGTLTPLPTKIYPVSELLDAFRFMTTGQHIGRIVIKMKGEPILISAK